jgi:MFS family permease
MTAQVTVALSARQVFKLGDFRVLWLAQSISRFGDSLTSLALLILINRLTGSTLALASLSIVLLLPQVGFGLVAGVFVDRLNRKRIMIASDTLRGVLVLGFLLVGSAEQIWLIYLLGFLQATIGAFFNPSLGAVLPNLVPRGGLLAANSIMQVSHRICLSLGTVAAGFLIGALNAYWPAFVLDALTFFIAPLLVSRLAIPTISRDKAVSSSGRINAVFSELVEGLKLVFGTRMLFGTLIGVGVAVLGQRAFDVLLIPLIDRELHTPATWLGLIYSGLTIATIFSGGLTALLANRLKPYQIIAYGLVILGIPTLLIMVIGNIWQLFLIAVSFGVIATPINASISTIIQGSVTDEIRGRVGASFETLISIASLTSMTLSGVFGDLLGIRQVFLFAGIITILSGLVTARLLREK